MLKETISYEVVIITYIITKSVIWLIAKAISFIFKKLKHDPQLLLREQIFFYNWESPLLKQENGLEKVNIYLFHENNIPKKSYYIYDYDKKILILK